MSKKPHICFLSGLEIPKGRYSREHIAPRSKVPMYIASHPYNIAPAIKIINVIKADRFLCEWEDQKYELCYHAVQKWNLKQVDKDIIIQALEKFKTEEPMNPCEHCVLSKIGTEYCYAQKKLEKYRAKWLYPLQFGKDPTQR